MKKKLPIIIGFILTLALAAFLGNTRSLTRFYDNDVNTATYTEIGVVPESAGTLTQQFLCTSDSIDGVGIKAKVYGECAGTQVHVQLKDASTGEILGEAAESGETFKTRKIHYFPMEGLTGLKDRLLTLSVYETGLCDASNGIGFYLSVEEGEQGKAAIGENALNGVLIFGTFIDGFNVERFLMLLLSIWFVWGFLWFLYRLFR